MLAEMARIKGSREIGFTLNWGNAILMPGIDVYRRLEDWPAHSMARTEGEFEAGKNDDHDRDWPAVADEDAASVMRTRERRLAASTPKTLHVLRNTSRGPALMAHGQFLGCAPWQVEQAICNLRSAGFLAYERNGKGKRLTRLKLARRLVLGPASAEVDLTLIPAAELES